MLSLVEYRKVTCSEDAVTILLKVVHGIRYFHFHRKPTSDDKVIPHLLVFFGKGFPFDFIFGHTLYQIKQGLSHLTDHTPLVEIQHLHFHIQDKHTFQVERLLPFLLET